jgi:hypothetical protein
VPVNYVNHAGVVLSAACFGNGQYLRDETVSCLSNLLVMNFRRFVVDIFWDVTRGEWSLCPVQLGTPSGRTSGTATTTTKLPETTLNLSSRPIGGRSIDVDALQTSFVLETINEKRQATTTAQSPSQPPTTAAATATSSAPPSADRYDCSPSTNLDLLLGVLFEHFAETNTDVNATMVTMTLNIHAARAASGPVEGQPQLGPADLPQGSLRLGPIFTENLGSLLYTPSQLASQRSILNNPGGWLEVGESYQPSTSYFTLTGDPIKSSPDGWPGEGYIELANYKRLIVGIDSIDAQMAAYNFSADAATIFPRGYLETVRGVDLTATGAVSSGCFFDAAQTSLSSINSSWAVASVAQDQSATQSDLQLLYNKASNMMKCGISPILNTTLAGRTADQDYLPYQSYAQSSIWSWAAGEPGNASAMASTSSNRCATLNSSSGHWQVSDCGSYRSGACQSNTQPYVWYISSPATQYYKVDDACPEGSSFEVPSTALENAYLLQQFRMALGPTPDPAGSLLWIDYNDLDVPTCWVTGRNTTCPYGGDSTNDRTKELVVPTVAGAIILLVTVLTLLVKCAGNRQNSKRRRRRGNDGWDYEGVPA